MIETRHRPWLQPWTPCLHQKRTNTWSCPRPPRPSLLSAKRKNKPQSAKYEAQNAKREAQSAKREAQGVALLGFRTHTTLNFITRVRAGEVGVAHYPKWRRSLLIHAETRDFHSRRGMGARTIALTIVDQFGIKISGFTPSYEALGRLLKNDDENSDFAYERFLVWRDEGS